jgi:Zn-dependent alcohol dehydrogenase
MKSVVIQQPNQLVIEERALPEPASGEVRVKINSPGSAVQTATFIADTTRLPNTRA